MEERGAEGTVLIADDNPENLSLAGDILRMKGYRIRVALDGKAALRSIKAEPPDLVLLDVHMPEMDGYQVCREIKEDPVLMDIPVIFLSGMHEVFNKLQAFKYGAVDYIVKPFNPQELIARVTTQIELNNSKKRIKEYSLRLEEALGEIQQTSQRLLETEKKAAISALGSGLAHELNNPLNYIVLGAEALSRNFKDLLGMLEEAEESLIKELLKNPSFKSIVEEIPALLNGLNIGAERSARILKSLESLSKSTKEEKEEVGLSAIIERSISLIPEPTREKVKIVKIFLLRPAIRCYPAKLTRLFHNLLDNAFYAALESADPRVQIQMELLKDKNGSWISITISDSGPGIPATLHSQIFNPFFTTKEVGHGAGLGLPIALQTATEHNGSLQLVNSSEQGTGFRLLLPVGNQGL